MHWIRKVTVSTWLFGVAATAGAAPVFRVGEMIVDEADLEVAVDAALAERRQAAAARALQSIRDDWARRHGVVVSAEGVDAVLRLIEELSGDPDGDEGAGSVAEEAAATAARRQITEKMVRRWTVDQALYQRFGGRVVFQQAGVEPVDAWLALIEESLDSGLLEILDPDYRDLFAELREYADNHGDVLEDEEVAEIFSQPWWLSGLKEPEPAPAADDLPGQIRALGEHGDADVRWQAAKILGESRPEEALVVLTAALEDPAEDVRHAAAGALGRYTGRAVGAVEALLATVAGDPSARVRGRAALTLSEIGPPGEAVVPGLVQSLGDADSRVRTYVAHALGTCGPDAAPAVERLIRSLDSDDFEERERAAWALGQIGPAALPATGRLQRLRLEDPEQAVRQSATLALDAIDAAWRSRRLRLPGSDRD